MLALTNTKSFAKRGNLPICAILYVKKSPADEEPGRERTAVSLSVDSYGMRGFGC
jgi:hypothetical protein